MKENILNFDGFKFGTDSEEYDERNDFLERLVKLQLFMKQLFMLQLFMKFLISKSKINFHLF